MEPNASAEQQPTVMSPSHRIPVSSLYELGAIIRGMIKHENELVNHRIQWFLTLNGLLFTALALYGDHPGRTEFAISLTIVGLLTCVSFGYALRLGGIAIHQLKARWDEICDNSPPDFVYIDVIGCRTIGLWKLVAPWIALPYIVAVGWVFIAIFQIVAASSATPSIP